MKRANFSLGKKAHYRALMLSALLFFLCLASVDAQTAVKGKVMDTQGEALSGVNVAVKDERQSTTTDGNGEFSIAVPTLNAVLSFTYIGFKLQEIPLNGRSYLEVTMAEDSLALEEIVVVGYGTQKKSTMTGSVAQIDSRQIMEAPTANISTILAGRLPGLTAVQSSGAPGSDNATLLVRGISTLGNASPMIIVDGIPRSFNQLDPNEIATISILKDASAAAVYGMQAANGVILVTTKKGSEKKTSLTYTSSAGISENTRFPEFMNGPQFAYYWNKAMELDGREPTFTESMLNSIETGTNGFGNTNWLDQVFRTGTTQHHNISIDGGTNKTRYFVSLGYFLQDGNVESFGFNRYNLRSNIETEIADNLHLTLNLAGRQENRDNPNTTPSTVVFNAIQMFPYLPMQYDGVDVASMPQYQLFNPISALNDGGYSKSQMNVFQSNLNLRWNVPYVKGLNVNVLGSYDYDHTYSKQFSTPYQLMLATLGYDGISYSLQHANAGFLDPDTGEWESTLHEGFGKASRITGQFSLDYANRFGDHDVSALLLYEYSRYDSNSFGVTGQGFAFNDIQELNLTNQIINQGKGYSGTSATIPRAGYVGRITYAYKDKYLAEVSGRYDGSYKFMPEKRWAFFPALSVGWRISEEDFFRESVSFMDNLKVRFSYGKLGSDANVNPFLFYKYVTPISVNPQVIIGGQEQLAYMTTGIPNPYLTWEVSTNYNAGVDASFWQGLLGVEFDVFYKVTEDILANQTGNYPSSVGNYFPAIINYGIVDNRGIELALTNNTKIGEAHFSARASFNWARNKIIRVADPDIPYYQRSIGRSIGEKEGFIALGLFQSQEEIDGSALVGSNTLPGDIRFQDLNGDGKIDWDQDRTWIGRSNTPEMLFGLNLGVTWRGFDFSTLLQGAALSDIALMGLYPGIGVDDTQFTRTFYNGGNSPLYLVENSWTPDNLNAKYPRLSTQYRYNGYSNTWWLFNGSYLRVKNVQVGYNFPNRVNNLIGSQKIRLYAAGSNLLTFSHNPFLDPEAPDVTNGYYPQQRVYTLGLSVTF